MIAVLGSINIDLVVEALHFPRPGETRRGLSFAQYPGGKGANQAVAAARLGGKVSFFGKIGNDQFGDELLKALQTDGVDLSAVEREHNSSSGIASIWVTQNGENMIMYVPGANDQVDLAYAEKILPMLSQSEILLTQLEIPLQTIAYVLERLPPRRPVVILDPAPAQDISGLPLSRVNILTPNRGELFSLTGEKNIKKAGKKILSWGVGTVICKAGADGAFLIERQLYRNFPGFKVNPIDTTAAGDAFNGALAVALFEGKSVEEALIFANAAGALSVTRKGAQPSLPFRDEVEEFIRNVWLR